MSIDKASPNQGLLSTTEERFKRDLIIVNNPVLIEGLALTPIIGAAFTLRNAVMLSIMIPFLVIPARFIGNLLVGLVPQKLRIMVYSIIASLFYLPGYLLLTRMFNIRIATLGVYLPMLVVDSIIVSRTEIPTREKIFPAFFNGILTSFGFTLAAVLVGGTREFLGMGKLWGQLVLDKPPLPIISTVAGGLMITAVYCAVFQYMVSLIKRARYRYAKESWRNKGAK